MGRHGMNNGWDQGPGTDEDDNDRRRGRGPRRGPGGGPGGPGGPGGHSHGHGPWGPGPFGEGGRRGRQGLPPWVGGLLGLDQGEERRGPRVRRGDVRAAILDVLRTAGEAEEQVNGYQVIQQIAARSQDAWKPSPGSVYPTIQQLQDEGLVDTDDERGRRSLTLTPEGTAYVAEHSDELAAVWRPFERQAEERQVGSYGDLKPEIGQVMGAVWQIVTTGSAGQRAAAVDILVDTRRRLYGILADGDQPEDETPEQTGA